MKLHSEKDKYYLKIHNILYMVFGKTMSEQRGASKMK